MQNDLSAPQPYNAQSRFALGNGQSDELSASDQQQQQQQQQSSGATSQAALQQQLLQLQMQQQQLQQQQYLTQNNYLMQQRLQEQQYLHQQQQRQQLFNQQQQQFSFLGGGGGGPQDFAGSYNPQQQHNDFQDLQEQQRQLLGAGSMLGFNPNMLDQATLQRLQFAGAGACGILEPSPIVSQGVVASSAAPEGGGMISLESAYAQNGLLGPWSATSAGLLGKMASPELEMVAKMGFTSGGKAAAPIKIKKTRKKSKDQPKRPLSAYNIFFKEERQRILNGLPEPSSQAVVDDEAIAADGGNDDDEVAAQLSLPERKPSKKNPHGKIGFENLAKTIGHRWQELGPKQVEYYKEKSEADKKRYRLEMDAYAMKQAGGWDATAGFSEMDREEADTKVAPHNVDSCDETAKLGAQEAKADITFDKADNATKSVDNATESVDNATEKVGNVTEKVDNVDEEERAV